MNVGRWLNRRLHDKPHLPDLAVVDFWVGHDPSVDPIVQEFSRGGLGLSSDVRQSLVTVASVFGQDHWNSKGCVVMYSGEPYFREEFADYTIDSRFLGRSNHLRFPFWAYNMMATPHLRPNPAEDSEPTAFCNFIYSNPRSAMRNAFFELLNSKKSVDSLGSLMNNRVDSRLGRRNDSNWHSAKFATLRDYRFTVAFENTELPGYTTEKMIDAWIVGSVPIYWGNPAFAIDFPPDSCLSLYEAGSLNKLVEQVLEAENEPERYRQLQAANPFRTGAIDVALNKYRASLAAFAEVVITDMRGNPKSRARHTAPRWKAKSKRAVSKLVARIERL